MTNQTLKDLDKASMDILETIGVRLHHEGMLALAAKNGIRVEDGRLFFTRHQLKEWISHAPSSFTLYAKNPEHNMEIGGDRTLHASSNSGFPFIADLDGNRRPALFSDYIKFVKLVHETDFFHINGGVMVTPGDLSNAESLVGVALAQMVRKGTPVIYGSATSGTDMRTGAFTIGSPESALAVKYCARLARMYGLPSRGGGTLNDAKAVSVQAGIESTMVQMVANQESINFNFHSAGGLDTYGAMSYEKFVVDLDILGRIRFFLDDIRTDGNSLALGPIKEVGPGGQFLTHMHTAMNCRTAAFISDISLQGALREGTTAGQALTDKMTAKVDRMLAGYCRPELPKDAIVRMDDCMTGLGIDLSALKDKIEVLNSDAHRRAQSGADGVLYIFHAVYDVFILQSHHS